MISWWRTSFGDGEVEKLRESVQKECIGQGLVTEEKEDFEMIHSPEPSHSGIC
mgnify:CR=1 FL=1